MKPKLEIACFHLSSAIIAQQAGADRIELCDEAGLGGISPGYESVKLAREKIIIDLFVMIRPRGGNFIYSPSEFAQMKNDVLEFKKTGVDGFVFGILNEDGSINKKQNRELVQAAHPCSCAFHRAFDVVTNPFTALEEIIDCGFGTILTSGQKQTAMEGIDVLVELVNKANNRIVIMPGGGVRSSNIAELKEKVKTSFYHSSAIMDHSEMANPGEIKLLKNNLNS